MKAFNNIIKNIIENYEKYKTTIINSLNNKIL